MTMESDEMNNIFMLADTLGIDLVKQGLALKGKGDFKVAVDDYQITIAFNIVTNFKLPQDNVGLVVNIKNWDIDLIVITTGKRIKAIIASKGNDYSRYTGGLDFNLKALDGILHKATRLYDSDEWKSF